MTDDELMARLEAATVEALRSEGPAILHNRPRLKGIHVELEGRNGGGIVEAEVYIQRTANVARILGPMPPAPAEAGGPDMSEQGAAGDGQYRDWLGNQPGDEAEDRGGRAAVPGGNTWCGASSGRTPRTPG
jgi:hypothetical protein